MTKRDFDDNYAAFINATHVSANDDRGLFKVLVLRRDDVMRYTLPTMLLAAEVVRGWQRGQPKQPQCLTCEHIFKPLQMPPAFVVILPDGYLAPAFPERLVVTPVCRRCTKLSDEALIERLRGTGMLGDDARIIGEAGHG